MVVFLTFGALAVAVGPGDVVLAFERGKGREEHGALEDVVPAVACTGSFDDSTGRFGVGLMAKADIRAAKSRRAKTLLALILPRPYQESVDVLNTGPGEGGKRVWKRT